MLNTEVQGSSFRHVYLYAKERYKKGQIMDDLKIILDKRAGIKPENIWEVEVAEMVSELTYNHIYTKQTFIQFFSSLKENDYVSI